MADVIDLCSARDRLPKKRNGTVNPKQHPEDWMLLSPTVFERVSGVRISRDELAEVREILYEIRARA